MNKREIVRPIVFSISLATFYSCIVYPGIMFLCVSHDNPIRDIISNMVMDNFGMAVCFTGILSGWIYISRVARLKRIIKIYHNLNASFAISNTQRKFISSRGLSFLVLVIVVFVGLTISIYWHYDIDNAWELYDSSILRGVTISLLFLIIERILFVRSMKAHGYYENGMTFAITIVISGIIIPVALLYYQKLPAEYYDIYSLTLVEAGIVIIAYQILSTAVIMYLLVWLVYKILNNGNLVSMRGNTTQPCVDS